MNLRRPRLRPVGALGITGALAATGLALLGGQAGNASSHREAPAIAGDPQADNTDTYAFVSPERKDTVTLLANWYPFQEPNGGPNFYPFSTDARYDIQIDNDGDGVPDITYQWTFNNDDKRGDSTFLYDNGPVKSLNDAHLLFKQRYTLKRITKEGSTTLVDNGIAAPSFTGKASMPDYDRLRREATVGVPGGGKTYAGGAADSFFLDLRVFDLLYGGNLKELGQDTLKGYNVNTLAIQVPKSDLALKGDSKRNPVIGVWATTERPGASVIGNAGGAAQGQGERNGNDRNGQSGNGQNGDGQNGNGGDNGGGKKACALPLQALCPDVSAKYGKLAADDEPGMTQVSRLGNPLVNEVVSAAGMKDKFNRTPPGEDHNWTDLVNRVLDPEVPKLVQGIYGLKAPAAPRMDLAEIFLTGIAKGNGPIAADLNGFKLNQDVDATKIIPAEMEHLNMNVPVTRNPNRLGVLAKDLQGFPNGRRLGDDVVDIELQALEGAAMTGKLVPAIMGGDGVNSNPKPFTRDFPYVAAPFEDAVNHGR